MSSYISSISTDILILKLQLDLLFSNSGRRRNAYEHLDLLFSEIFKFKLFRSMTCTTGWHVLATGWHIILVHPFLADWYRIITAYFTLPMTIFFLKRLKHHRKLCNSNSELLRLSEVIHDFLSMFDWLGLKGLT